MNKQEMNEALGKLNQTFINDMNELWLKRRDLREEVKNQQRASLKDFDKDTAKLNTSLKQRFRESTDKIKSHPTGSPTE